MHVKSTKRPARCFAELTVFPNGQIKFGMVKRLVDTNQYKRKWVRVRSRELARTVNNGEIVIK